MRRIMVAVGVGVALCCPSPAAAAAQKRDCGSRAGETLARSRDMRVYAVYDDVLEATSYRACWIRTHKAMRLAEFDENGNHFADWLDHFAIAGRYLTFAHIGTFDQEDGAAFQIVLVDVRGRRQVRKGRFTRGDPIGLRVNRLGEVGMLTDIRGSTDHWVVKFDAGGEVVLDHGRDVTWLTLNGRTLGWIHGNEWRTYEFG